MIESEFVKQFHNDYLTTGSRVLDAGCGNGSDSIFLAEKGHEVSALGLSEVAIARAKQESEERGLEIDFQVGDIEKLPYADYVFDAIYSGYNLQRIDLLLVSSEFNRVLKAGGVAYLVVLESTDYAEHDNRDLILDHDTILKAFTRYFYIAEQAVDEYEEEDQHGSHHHKRLVLVLRK